jgi:hypothetical protein
MEISVGVHTSIVTDDLVKVALDSPRLTLIHDTLPLFMGISVGVHTYISADDLAQVAIDSKADIIL